MGRTSLFASCFFLLTFAFGFVTSARILDELVTQPSNPAINAPQVQDPANSLPSGQIPTSTTGSAPGTDDEEPAVDSPFIPEPAAPEAPAASEEDETPEGTAIDAPAEPPQTEDEEEEQPAAGAAPAADVDEPVAGAATAAKEPHLSVYMHDILGGSHPTARVVTGIIAQTEVNGIPFSKAYNNFFPMQGGVPLLNQDVNGIVNQNNLPFLAGLTGPQSSTVIQNSGNSNLVTGGDNQPFVSAGNLPAGATLQKLMFGTVTVVDDGLTEGHELGSGAVGKAQGFYLASSLDGTSQSMVLTLLLHGHGHEFEDSISLFGVHRTPSHVSQIAVIGGTGKYENARGYATVETLHQENEHTTDGVDTIVHFSVYLSE